MTEITDRLVDSLKNGIFIDNINTIIDEGRNKPDLRTEIQTKINNKKYTRKFNKNIYDDFPWITGSTSKNSLFCFYCLIFNRKQGYWISKGVTRVQNMRKYVRTHSMNKRHLDAVKTYFNFVNKKMTLINTRNFSYKSAKEEERNKNKVLKTIIEAALYFINQEIAFRGKNETETSLDVGIFYP